MFEDYTIIYAIFILLLISGLIALFIKKRNKKKTPSNQEDIQRKRPETIEELFEEYEEPDQEPVIKLISKPKQKKPKKPVSLLDQDFEF